MLSLFEEKEIMLPLSSGFPKVKFPLHAKFVFKVSLKW